MLNDELLLQHAAFVAASVTVFDIIAMIGITVSCVVVLLPFHYCNMITPQTSHIVNSYFFLPFDLSYL